MFYHINVHQKLNENSETTKKKQFGLKLSIKQVAIDMNKSAFYQPKVFSTFRISYQIRFQEIYLILICICLTDMQTCHMASNFMTFTNRIFNLIFEGIWQLWCNARLS